MEIAIRHFVPKKAPMPAPSPLPGSPPSLAERPAGRTLSIGGSGPGALLDIRIRLSSTLALVRLVGELDLSSEHLLADALGCIEAASCRASLVVLDLAGVTFCDAAGLRAMEACAARLTAEGKELRLSNVSRPVARLLAICHPALPTGSWASPAGLLSDALASPQVGAKPPVGQP